MKTSMFLNGVKHDDDLHLASQSGSLAYNVEIMKSFDARERERERERLVS